ncbi:hypothetical protein Ssi03_76410 [Sphaerisporangium siamense]|uniref:Uncharacterized protein n=1 Tax=Sphaerisporangium siamense TaxID=795645 RepID=A0A7W7G7M7_9ACTN|nr:hypothetical protein [Sphaerisporangium siamense]MBB4699322.1 hypothetical protein [Sphaerisporangium siamense]GII89651.1 hypothetical protein Ssi03_76410 [Sphaerisporangium siamense]
MTVPTPRALAESLVDLGSGFITEVGGEPNPMLGHHIHTMAKRLTDRVQSGDTRLTAFEGITDAGGYVWLGTHLAECLAEAMRESWSFERWFTTLAQEVARTEPLAPEKLAELRAMRTELDGWRDQGLRLTEIDRATGLVRFER